MHHSSTSHKDQLLIQFSENTKYYPASNHAVSPIAPAIEIVGPWMVSVVAIEEVDCWIDHVTHSTWSLYTCDAIDLL